MRSNIKVLLVCALAAFAVSSCDRGPNCDTTTGLRKDCVMKIAKALPEAQYSTQYPGESTKIPRTYMDAPPQVPHSLEGLEINTDANACMMCHNGGMEEATAIPASHKAVAVVKINKAMAPQTTKVIKHKASADLDPARYFCLTCHVPQAGNLQPLVVNHFKK